MFEIFKTKCPSCKSSKLTEVKESFADSFFRNAKNLAFPIRLFMGYASAPKPLMVCNDCGFSWEKR